MPGSRAGLEAGSGGKSVAVQPILLKPAKPVLQTPSVMGNRQNLKAVGFRCRVKRIVYLIKARAFLITFSPDTA
jgi:hypothetical protein